jgi:hypothetical protein
MFASFNTLSNDVGNNALKLNAVQQLQLVTDAINGVHDNLTGVADRAENGGVYQYDSFYRTSNGKYL